MVRCEGHITQARTEVIATFLEMGEHSLADRWKHQPQRLGACLTILFPNADLTFLLTYLLTPWSRVLVAKLTVFHLVKKFPTFYGTQRLITANLTFVVPCSIIIYFYNKTNQMHNTSNLFYLLASSHRTCMVWCCMYSLRLLMMDEETVRNTYNVVPK